MSSAPLQPEPDPGRRRAGELVRNALVLLAGGLVALLVVTDLVNRSQTGGDAFVTPTQLSTTLLFAAILGLLSTGQMLVMLSGGIDLSVTATATAAAFIVAGVGANGAVPAILAALGLGLGLGIVNGTGVAILRVNPLLMTLGIATITLAALPIYRQGHPSEVVPDFVQTLGSDRFGTYVPYDLLVWGSVAVLVVLALRSTRIGRSSYAGGRSSTEPVPARPRVVLVLVYASSGLLAAAAGVLLAGLNNAADLGIATPLLLPSIAAVMLGGTSSFGNAGRYAGTILGVLMITVLDSLLTIVGAGQGTRQIVYASIVLVLAAAFARTGEREWRRGPTEVGSRP